ncbi:MAG: phosphatidylserine decarboxylase [Pseudomonadota bacterium]
MSFFDTFMDRLSRLFTPIHPDGHRFIAIAVVVTLVLLLISDTLGWLAIAITAWLIFFFRDPERVVPLREGLIVSPADGTVMSIDEVTPTSELELGVDSYLRVAIHLSLFDMHIQRVPLAGTLVHAVYMPGTFASTRREKAHEDNERNASTFETGDGLRVAVVQIAGGVRRRIVALCAEGARLGTGERLGLIRFGSRVDLYVPQDVGVLVAVGQTMVAGETVIADLKSDEQERGARAV